MESELSVKGALGQKYMGTRPSHKERGGEATAKVRWALSLCAEGEQPNAPRKADVCRPATGVGRQ